MLPEVGESCSISQLGWLDLDDNEWVILGPEANCDLVSETTVNLSRVDEAEMPIPPTYLGNFADRSSNESKSRRMILLIATCCIVGCLVGAALAPRLFPIAKSQPIQPTGKSLTVYLPETPSPAIEELLDSLAAKGASIETGLSPADLKPKDSTSAQGFPTTVRLRTSGQFDAEVMHRLVDEALKGNLIFTLQ